MRMKPILFNIEMVKGLLSGRKTATRRVVKPQLITECSHGVHEFIKDSNMGGAFTGFVCRKCGYGVCGLHDKWSVGTSWIRSPYHPGDTLYVRETWQYAYDLDEYDRVIEETGRYLYAADENNQSYNYWVMPDGTYRDSMPWRPSIHMPKEAARIFLRVTDVRVERLQDMQPYDIAFEGFRRQRDFIALWNSTLRPEDRALYGWEANPWVWVIEFEKITKEEALAHERE